MAQDVLYPQCYKYLNHYSTPLLSSGEDILRFVRASSVPARFHTSFHRIEICHMIKQEFPGVGNENGVKAGKKRQGASGSTPLG